MKAVADVSNVDFSEEARRLEFDDAEFTAAMGELLQLSREFLAGRAAEKAFSPPAAVAPSAFREGPTSIVELLRELFETLNASGVTTTSGRFFGYIPGGGLPTSAFAEFVAALVNSYSGIHGASPGAVSIENDCLRLLVKLFGFPESGWGCLLSGGSMATITALAVAREQFFGTREHAAVYMTDQAHLCGRKALKTIGMGHCRISLVATDGAHRMDVADLKRAIARDRAEGYRPWLLFASAGTTNTGAVDPLAAAGAVARENGMWFHVDGAYGGLFVLTERGRAVLEGIEQADSLVIDPHKALFLPYGLGACLLRDGGLLKSTFSEDAAYLADSHNESERSPSDYSPELTRHFRGLRLWLSLRTHGTRRFVHALEEKLILARRLADQIRQIAALELHEEPQLTVVVFHHRKGDAATRQLLHELLERGRVHVSSTVIDGVFYLRACVLSFRSHQEDIEALGEELKRVLAKGELAP